MVSSLTVYDNYNRALDAAQLRSVSELNIGVDIENDEDINREFRVE